MKKQIKKLSLNKKTISNLALSEMSKHVGGNLARTAWDSCLSCNYSWNCTGFCTITCHGHTCNKTCGF